MASRGPVNQEEAGRETMRGSKVAKQMQVGQQDRNKGVTRFKWEALVPIRAWCSEVRLSRYNRVQSVVHGVRS